MDQKQQIADRLKDATNVLVTVSNSPSVDQLAACIGLTLALNKQGKHASAVFSGKVPSTLEFLQPEKTIETNTDSLRDFIISLDKAKADKLRYKVEDKVVKIFITPYRTSLTDKDLEFGQGDFNVDVVIALGVHAQGDLDQAITSHGRILHDATVVTVNIKPGGELGSMNWLDPQASSLSELVVQLIDVTDKQVIDAQIATALLTGIVAETGRFRNEKTSPTTMSISAELMAAGANQQLVATKLDESAIAPVNKAELKIDKSDAAPAAGDKQPAVTAPKADDGTLEISHQDKPAAAETEHKISINPPASAPPKIEAKDDKPAQIDIDDQGQLRSIRPLESKARGEGTTDPTQHMGGSRMILHPPTMSAPLSASGTPDGFSVSDPLSLPQPTDPSAPPASPFGAAASATIASPSLPFMPASMTPAAPSPAMPTPPPAPLAPEPVAPAAPAPPAPAPDLSNPASAVPAPAQSTPLASTTHLDNARDAVQQAIASQPPSAARPDPIHALNAQPLGDPLRAPSAPPAAPIPSAPPPDLNVTIPGFSGDPGIVKPTQPAGITTTNPNLPPPPVPPPMIPPSQ